jgi:hypothetical protein
MKLGYVLKWWKKRRFWQRYWRLHILPLSGEKGYTFDLVVFISAQNEGM